MKMSDILKPLSLVALVALAAPAFAQDATEGDATEAEQTEAPTEEAPAAGAEASDEAPATAGSSEPQLGQPVGIEEYVDDVFGDWERACLRIPNNEEDDPCQITQLLYDGNNENPVGKFSVGKLPEEMEATAGSAIIVPLGVSLQDGLTISIDGGAAKKYGFTSCEPIGCVAQFGFTEAEVAALKAGSSATISVVPANARDQRVEIPASLSGFTDAFNSLVLPVPPEAPTSTE
ncbi:invasion associated locus B family protein [Maritimibacter dapengensis]|nr:invasion associated locus B family protein [Maritimibacter dapengensis]